ncbi:MAG: WYL domain-containing protein [Spirochaetia bacterium]|jgi:predicted DNA-binding transcriptional regulator YafY|nr:WYL domain-containing protein [Spirochaetia bacterium]
MKGERVAQLELLLLSHPEGLRRAEIARRLGVHRSTISRYVTDLSQYIDVYEENNLIKIRNKNEDENIELSVYESLAFNMSAEILAQNTEFQNPHLASGLRKIALSMRVYAPKISENIMQLAEEIDKEVQKKSGNSQYSSILDVLIDSWVSGRIVKIEQKIGEKKSETELAPYFIGFREDSTGRNPISVTGRLRHTPEMVTIDISTITKAVILDQTYTIPDNLKPFKRPEESDSYDSIDMVHLSLKIKEESAMNVFHGLNHDEPKIENFDGYSICTMDVENSTDLLLKIIQCGNSVEILEPENFRSRFVYLLEGILSLYH